MKIRKARKEDLNEIAKLYYQNMNKHFSNIGEKSINTKEYSKILNKNFKKSAMYVLYGPGIKGFIWYFKRGNEYNLEEIFVTEHKKGYGKLLMDFLINNAKKHKINKINLDVHINNIKAIKFFNKFGFSERTIEMSKDLR